MIQAICHHPDHESCWEQTFQVAPREGETIVRAVPSRGDPDDLGIVYPVFVVEMVEHQCDAENPAVPARLHLFLEILDTGGEDDEDGPLLPEFPPPGRAQSVPN